MSQFDFDTFNLELEQDLDINFKNIEKKIFDVPKLHSKYLKIFFEEQKKLNKIEKELQRVYKDKYHYYQFDYQKKMESLKETEFHVLADPEYAKMNHIYKNQKLIVDCVERSLKRIQSLGYDVKTMIEALKYFNGV